MIINYTSMATLISCPKHNMVACLEKTERNAQFHEIVDFFTRSSIYYSLTLCPTVSTSPIKQFWNTATSKTVNDTGHAEDEQENFALMAYSNSGSNTEVTSCSKECEESYAKLKKLYDEQREQLGDASIEIQAYIQALN
ncbi:hypothetical protein Tco_0098628 [Tanacetum coccineum]